MSEDCQSPSTNNLLVHEEGKRSSRSGKFDSYIENVARSESRLKFSKCENDFSICEIIHKDKLFDLCHPVDLTHDWTKRGDLAMDFVVSDFVLLNYIMSSSACFKTDNGLHWPTSTYVIDDAHFWTMNWPFSNVTAAFHYICLVLAPLTQSAAQDEKANALKYRTPNRIAITL